MQTEPEISVLGGKVRKGSLPIVERSAGPAALGNKRLLLPQGELAQFHDSDIPIRYIAFIELLEGSTRGNHYHRTKEESIYIIRGRVEFLAEEITSKQREIIPLQAGDLVFVSPLVAHALRVIESGQAVEFSPGRFDSADIYRYPLL